MPDEAVYQRKLTMTRDLLNKEMVVWEFGCGTGTTARTLSPHVNKIIATDFSKGMVDIAREKATAEGVTNVMFQQVSVEEAEIQKGSIDVVLAHSILHLVRDKEAAIQKAYDSLKPGGWFVSSTACINDFLKPLKYVAPLGRALGLLPNLTCFSQGELLSSFKKAGFSIHTEWKPESKKSKAVFVIAQKPK